MCKHASGEDACEDATEIPDSMHAGSSYAALGEVQHAARKLPAGSSMEDEFGNNEQGSDDGNRVSVIEVSRTA